MTYHLGRDGTQLGTFPENKLQEALNRGELRPTDVAWCEGMGDWLPLSEVLQSLQAKTSAATSAPPFPPVPSAQPPAAGPMPYTALPQTGGGTSGLAIASLVLGIASLVLSCITGIPAIICGIMALNKIGKSNGAEGGKGLAITGICLGSVFTVIVGIMGVFAALAVPTFSNVQDKARQMQASNNARQIIIAMKAYAGDHGGHYPDADESRPKTANEVFRLLIKGGYLEDERVFSIPGGVEVGDNNLGPAPDYPNALQRNENHWAVVTGLTDADNGDLPLVFESPNDTAWPPTWNADAAGQPVKARAWKGGKIIVGRNDASVNVEKLQAPRGARVTTEPGMGGINPFDPAKPLKYLVPEY